MILRCRAPLRLGLAGGGTDVPPFSTAYGGCVLNATIDRFVYATLKEIDQDAVIFEACDLGIREELPPSSYFPLNEGLALHRAVYNYFIREYNNGKPARISVHTLAEAPAGSGLGTSSTLVVALCALYAEYFRVIMDEYEIAQLAWKLERVDCGFAGGAQDQYAAAFGGVNFMEFMPSGRVLVNPLRVKKNILNEFESSMLLYFSGISRASERIIRSQSENAERNDLDAIKAMMEIKQEAYAMKAALLTGDFELLANSFRKGWESKKRMSTEISSSHIDQLFEDAMGAGAEAGKISGAGGGGFMMVIVPPHSRNRVIAALRQHGGEIFPAHFTHSGVEVWRKRRPATGATGGFSAQRR